MTLVLSRRHAAGLLLAGLAAPAFPGLAAAQGRARSPAADREAIKAMAGDYRVTFDFNETVAMVPEYTPIEDKISGGFEAVRVIEDTGDFISLQHILVVGPEDAPVVVKHWRQDWAFEPRRLLAYTGPNTWVLREVNAAERTGAWSQTVWQTDDSPRYAAVGQWRHDLGVPRWTGARELRPLARRDAIRYPVYDRYDAVNRHALTPNGWVHEQDNFKIGPREGELTTYVHEVVLNTYERSDEFDAGFADRYWADTVDYWAAVRGAWDAAIEAGGGIVVAEEADNGSISGPRLMGLADEIHAGEISAAEAIARARGVITEVASVPRTFT